MSALYKILEAYRDMFGVKTDRANDTHRNACIELAALVAERDALKAFARELIELSDWPDGGDIDGFDFQDAAVKHGILIPEQRSEPCGEDCSCNAYYSDEEWKEGITCYRLAAALKAGDA